MNYLIVLRPTRVGMVKEGPTEREAAIVGEHFDYLQAHARAGKVRLAGRTSENDERTVVAHGVMRAELYPFRLAIS